jgi:hypothetical protein
VGRSPLGTRGAGALAVVPVVHVEAEDEADAIDVARDVFASAGSWSLLQALDRDPGTWFATPCDGACPKGGAS